MKYSWCLSVLFIGQTHQGMGTGQAGLGLGGAPPLTNVFATEGFSDEANAYTSDRKSIVFASIPKRSVWSNVCVLNNFGVNVVKCEMCIIFV